jgi:hypothetical protein
VVVGILSADVDIEHGIGVRFSSRPGAAGEPRGQGRFLQPIPCSYRLTQAA